MIKKKNLVKSLRKISNSDRILQVESVQYLSKQPQGLTFLTMHNIREIELKGFDKAKYIFKWSIASSLMLESLRIEECHGLEHIIDTKDEYEKENLNAIFQSLRNFSVRDCGQLKYIFGQYPVANKDCEEIHIHFSALEILSFYDLPNFVSICATNSLTMTYPSLKEFMCYRCSYPFYDPVSCLMVPTNSREPISNLKSIQNHFLSLQYLSIRNCEVEDIFCLNGPRMIGQPVSLKLKDLFLENLPQMTYIWVASMISVNLQHLTTLIIMRCAKLKVIFPPSVLRSLQKLKSLIIKECMELKQIFGCEQETSKNSFTFPNLERLEIIGCEKLQVVFPKFVLRCLPELNHLNIRECKELRQIIEEDVKDKKLSNLVSPQPCFPKLEALYVEHCDRLKRFISGSASNDLPNLHVLIINGASELEEFVACVQEKGDHIGKSKVELPRLKLLIFMHLSKFCQETELPNLKNCVVYECPKLSLTPTTTLTKLAKNLLYEDFEDTEVSVGDIREFISSQIDEQSMKEFIEEEPGSEHNQNEAHSPEIGDVGNESIEEGPAVEGDKTKPLLTGVEDISNGGGVATHVQSGGVDILAKHSKVVEQDDKMNEGMAGITPSQEIQLEEGLNLLDKQEEIHIVSNNNNIDISPASADIHTRLGAYKHFVDLDDAQIALLVEAITTYPHLWNACEKFSERFQAWRLKILADMLLFLQKGSGDNVIPQREKDFHKLCEKAIEIGFESSWVDEMRQRVVVRDPKLREEIAQRQMDENPKRSSSVEMVLDSQAVEHGDGPNENCKRTSPSVKTQNVNNNFEEGSNLVDKEGEIVVVSNDRIVTARNEEPKKEFVAKVSTSKIPRTTTSLTNSQPVERPSPSYSNIPLRETHSNALVDKQRISELCLMNQQKPLGEITEIWSNQTETDTAKESEGHPKIIQDFGANDIMSLFAPIVVGKEGEDNLVGNTLVELEKYLKMSLKDIVSSETNNIRLLSALNFLSNLPFKDVTLSDGLKDIIGTMQQEFPSIVCSFKRGFATIEKLAKLEARGNEVTISLGSKISEAKNFYDEAQLKEVVLKEEIKVCEDALSSLEEEKNKCIAETIGYKMELENVRKDNSQMVEDQRKIEQKLFEVTYKWSILCSQYEYNRMTARNPS
ncbi:uncharacterized protein [Phaseolus vulgaris]|uniref:uncharacterized protein isoform X5 n=1 Tax=Phaseolus vulgaris TaxID=3885 RepID=UPI0035CA4E1D